MSAIVNGSALATRARSGLSFPRTLFGWIKWVDNAGATQTPFGVGQASANNVIAVSKITGTFRMFGRALGSGGTKSRDTGVDAATSWQPMMLYMPNASDMYVRYAGGSELSDLAFSVSTDPTTWDTSFFGGLISNGANSEFADARIAELTEWAGDQRSSWATLAGGALPESVGSPVSHHSLLSDLTGSIGSAYTVIAGTVTFAAGDHPVSRGDTTPPALTSPTATGGTLTGTGGITSNEAGTSYFLVNTSATALTIPTAPAAMTGWTSRSMTAAPQTFSLSTLTAGSGYYLHQAAEDAAGNRTTTDVVAGPFTVAGAAGPTLTTPTKSTPTATTAVIGFTTNDATGTARAVLTLDNNAPSAAQVKAGQDAAGSSATTIVPTALTITSTGAKSFAAATAVSGTTRYGWIVHTNAASADSNVLPLGPVYPGTFRPVSDVTVTGWTVTGAATHAAALNEDTASGAEYSTSPALSNTPVSQILALDKPLPAGTYTFQVQASVSAGSGFVRLSALDGSNVAQGTSADQPITTTPTTYSLTVTTTGAATRLRIEVWN